MHGSRRRRQETGASRHCRAALAPPADPAYLPDLALHPIVGGQVQEKEKKFANWKD
jgi:hypothetical protein